MASRTVQQMIATVMRKTAGKVTPTDVYEALVDGNKRIHRLYRWPWLSAEANIQVNAAYSTGTVSLTDATNIATGTGTTWAPAWKYRRLFFGSNTDYLISNVSGATALTLKQTVSTGQNWTNAGYTIYQDIYPLPSDCEPATDIVLVNPRIRYRLLHLPRQALEGRATSLGVYFSNYQDSFCDAGFDDANREYLIKLSPPPSSTTEYKLIYRRRVPDLAQLTSQSSIPESFDECLVLMAEYLVKRPLGLPGWTDAKQEAYQIARNMRQQMSTGTMDIFSLYGSWPLAQPNASMYSSGLLISPPSGSL